jgi:fructuronate reductase
MEADLTPFAVLSCDNLPHNGAVTARVVTEFAEAVDAKLGRWVRDNVAFPGTMIDRIVPATTDADRAEVAALTGLDDAWPVVGEPFLQWVVEDKFAGQRPPLEIGGAEWASDVAPYERMKLRMLNGTHSSMAYLGYLGGYEFIADVIADPHFQRFIGGELKEEIAPTLGMAKAETDAYAVKLLKRYSNTAMKHRTYQIAMDGSQKLPQRLLGTISDRLRAGAPIERLSLTLAAWMIYAQGKDFAASPSWCKTRWRPSLRRSIRGSRGGAHGCMKVIAGNGAPAARQRAAAFFATVCSGEGPRPSGASQIALSQ